jgi:tetratricopeptide (TPR) repeat protein
MLGTIRRDFCFQIDPFDRRWSNGQPADAGLKMKEATTMNRHCVLLLWLLLLATISNRVVAQEAKPARLPPGLIRGPSQQVLDMAVRGRTLRNQGDFEAARQAFDEALALARAINDKSGETWAISNLATTYRYQAGLTNISANLAMDVVLADKAIDLYKEALAIAQENKDKYNEAYATLYLGVLAAGRGETDRAFKHYDAAMQLYKAVDDRYYIGRTYVFMGATALYIKRDPQDAIPFFEKALPELRESEMWHEAQAVAKDLFVAYGALSR